MGSFAVYKNGAIVEGVYIANANLPANSDQFIRTDDWEFFPIASFDLDLSNIPTQLSHDTNGIVISLPFYWYSQTGKLVNVMSFSYSMLINIENSDGGMITLDYLNTYTQDGQPIDKATTGNNNAILFPVLGLAALYMLMNNTNNEKNVGVTKDEAQTGLILVGGGIGLILVVQLLQALGIWDNGKSKSLNDLSTDPNSAWNPNYWKTKPANVNFTNPISLQQAQQYAEIIYNACGFFNDDEASIIDVFHRLPSRAAVSYLADVFGYTYKKDLLTFLRGGVWPQDCLSDDDVYSINQFISNLPKY